jgi:hypothetical protein
MRLGKGIWAVALAICFLTTAAMGDRPVLIAGVKNVITWGLESKKAVMINLHFKTKVRPKELIIRMASQAGMDYMVLFDGVGVRLPHELTSKYTGGINAFGDLEEGFFVQAAEHDFDGDGMPEIIIAVGDGSSELIANVFKYHPPEQQKDAGRPQNWDLVGQFDGQAKITIDGPSVTVPYGGQGLVEEWTWVKGKFVKTTP